MRGKKRKAAIILLMPHLFRVCPQGKFWFFLPVPFLYKKFPFRAGERILVTVTPAPKEKRCHSKKPRVRTTR